MMFFGRPVRGTYLLFLFFKVCCAFNIFEFIFGPKLGNGRISAKSFEIPPAQLLIESEGYVFETHEVTSKTGHILTLHRIPRGKEKTSKDSQRPVALFQHGLLAASDSWLFRGAEKDLPYILAKAGYDVWLSNMRGNIYSNRHAHLDPDRDADYWNFGLEEVANYDLPAIIDYILETVKQPSLFFLGHSIGSTVGLMLCSLKPEYNSKIKTHLALAPLVYVTHPISFTHKLIFSPMKYLSKLLLAQDIHAIFPRRKYFSQLMELICKDGMPTQQLCLATIFLVVGFDYPQLNTTTIPSMLSYYPSGTSIYLALHTLQLYLQGQFSALDYENATLNNAQYHNSTPPYYNLSSVTHPVLLMYGSGDYFVTESDITYLANKLPNAIGKYPVPYKNFNHMDFMWGTDAKNLLYERLLVLMNKYR